MRRLLTLFASLVFASILLSCAGAAPPQLALDTRLHKQSGNHGGKNEPGLNTNDMVVPTAGAKWVLFRVDADGHANVTSTRLVPGAPSSCSAEHPSAADHHRHAVGGHHEDDPMHYLVVSVREAGEASATCHYRIKDPRLRAFDRVVMDSHAAHEPRHPHSHHHAISPRGSFALRLPLTADAVEIEAHSHVAASADSKVHGAPEQQQKHEPPHSRHTAPLTHSALQLSTVVPSAQHQERREAVEQGTSMVSIETSQLQMDRLQEVGDPREQFNIIFVSSGYNGHDRQGYYFDDAAAVMRYLQGGGTEATSSAQPFPVYYSTFNVYRVWHSSNEAGASKPARGVSIQNNFDCSYGPTVQTNLDCDHDKILLAASWAPADSSNSVVIVLVYDVLSGGSGGGGIAIAASQAPGRLETLLHQLGHAVGGVSDEYTYGQSETKRVPMKNCWYQSYNTPWQDYINQRVVPESSLGCTFDNYYGPVGGNCIMASWSKTGFCPVCQFFVLQALYNNGMKLIQPSYPMPRETAFITPTGSVSLQINPQIANMLKTDLTNQFRVSWFVNGNQVALQQSNYTFSSVILGTHMINVTVEDRTSVFLDQNRQTYNQRFGNGPKASLQNYGFRVQVVATITASTCTNKNDAFGNAYCAVCDTGASCTSYAAVAFPTLSVTQTTADLAGLKTWMIAIGIVFVVVGLLIFVIAWRVMNVHQENAPIEILPLTENILVVRGVLIGVQLLVLVIATFTIIYCVYQYGQLTVFGQSIILGVIACAVVVWFSSYLGVVAAYYKSRSLLFVNFILLLLLFGCVLLFSVLLVYVLTNVNDSGVVDQLRSEWQTAVANRPVDVCNLQSYLQCSGFNSSCAFFSATAPQGSTDCPASCSSNTYSNPCLSYIQNFVQTHFGAASAGGWVLTALLLAALVLSVLLGCAIKNRRNTVHRERRVRHATGQNILLPEEIAMLRKEFNKIDRDGSGDISREEFSLFYNAVMGTDLSPRELEEYFDKLDADGNGNLSFEEFLKVYVPHREPRRKSMVKPKNVVEISSSSSNSSSEDERAEASTQMHPPTGRQDAYAKETQHFDDDFAFEAPRGGGNATPSPSTSKRGGGGGGGGRSPQPPTGLNVSQQSSSSQQPARQNFGGPGASLGTSQQSAATRGGVDLRSSYDSRTSGQRGGAPPPRGGRPAAGRGAPTADDLDLDIDMDNDFM